MIPDGAALRLSEEMQQGAKDKGMTSLHLQIRDVTAPDEPGLRKAALTFARELAERVQAGDTVTVYCRGGLGRSGMMAAAALTQLGVGPREAIQAVRNVRPRAIETISQEGFVHWAAGAS